MLWLLSHKAQRVEFQHICYFYIGHNVNYYHTYKYLSFLYNFDISKSDINRKVYIFARYYVKNIHIGGQKWEKAKVKDAAEN
jgi:hypothetical protein